MEGLELTKQSLSRICKGLKFCKYKRIGMNVLLRNRQVTLQIRESRYHDYHESKGKPGHSWHDIRESDFLTNKADFYVFFTHLTDFETPALVVPRTNLEKFLQHKVKGRNNVYRFYFHFNGKEVIECRDELIDYSHYLNRWDLIKSELET